jgi:hypothetical protein
VDRWQGWDPTCSLGQDRDEEMSATNNPGWSQGGGSEGDTVWFLSCSAPEKDQVEGKWEAAYASFILFASGWEDPKMGTQP